MFNQKQHQKDLHPVCTTHRKKTLPQRNCRPNPSPSHFFFNISSNCRLCKPTCPHNCTPTPCFTRRSCSRCAHRKHGLLLIFSNDCLQILRSLIENHWQTQEFNDDFYSGTCKWTTTRPTSTSPPPPIPAC